LRASLIGTLGAMIMVGRLLAVLQARYLIFSGLVLASFTLYQMVGFTNARSGRGSGYRICLRLGQ
jgi:hypothetical protein